MQGARTGWSAVLWLLLLLGPGVAQAGPMRFSGTLELTSAAPFPPDVLYTFEGVAQRSGGVVALTTPLSLGASLSVKSIDASFAGPSRDGPHLYAGPARLLPAEITITGQGFSGLQVAFDSIRLTTHSSTYACCVFTASTTISYPWRQIASYSFLNATVGGGGSATGVWRTRDEYPQTPSRDKTRYSATRTWVGGTWSLVSGTLGTDGGTLQLVSPLAIQGGSSDLFSDPPSLRLTLAFVPEPSTGVLCGLGLLGLAWRGRRLQRRVRDVGHDATPPRRIAET